MPAAEATFGETGQLLGPVHLLHRANGAPVRDETLEAEEANDRIEQSIVFDGSGHEAEGLHVGDQTNERVQFIRARDNKPDSGEPNAQLAVAIR